MPHNRSLDKSGYADLGLGFDAAGPLPHGYENASANNNLGETSVNRSPGPRRTNDTAPLGYVNRSVLALLL